MAGDRTAATWIVLLLVVAVAVGGAITVASAADVTVVLEEDRLAPGEETTLSVSIVNQAEFVEGAQGTVVSVDGEDTPVTVLTANQAVGTVPTGTSRTARFDVVVDEDADPGTYELEVELEYREGGIDGDLVTETRDVEVTIDDRAQFRVVDATTDAHVGEPGTVELTLENVGKQPAQDATVTVSALDQGFRLGNYRTVTRTFAGEWEAGETRTLELAARAAGTTEARTHELQATVDFEDEDGVERRSRTLSAGVDVGTPQSFAVETVTSDLRVGEDGTVTATVSNDGPRTATNVVAVVESPNPNVVVRDPERYAGTIEPGEEATVEFRIGLREDAEDGDRLLPLLVRYRTPTDEIGYADRLDLPVTVAPEREPFALEALDPDLDQGETVRYEVEIENTAGETVTDVEAKLFADAPLEPTDDEAYVERLEPNETATVGFGLEADDDATPGTYPVSVDLRYEDEDGDRHLTDRIRLPATVHESPFPWATVLIVGGVALAAAGGLAYWQRDRIGSLVDVDADAFGSEDR